MKKELIKTPEYLLVVDDSVIKDVRPYKGKWHLEKGYILNKFPVYLTDLSYCKIIIAHLPLNDSPILEGVPLLPLLEQEDDVEKLAEEEYPIIPNTSPNVNWDRANKQEGFVEGYNKAREKYKFTEEDIRDVIMVSFLLGVDRREYSKEFEDEIIKKFSQPKTPTYFEFTTFNRCWCMKPMNGGCPECTIEIITTTNSQGQQVACGKYIY